MPRRQSFGPTDDEGYRSVDSRQRTPRRDRQPLWGCSCGCDNNWATRDKCRECGKEAPKRTKDRAKNLSKPSIQNENSRVKKLVQERDSLREQLAKAKSSSSSDMEVDQGQDTADAPAISDLVADHDKLVKKYGADHAMAKTAATCLAEARAERDGKKSGAARVRDAERAVERKKKSHELAKKEAEAAQQALEEAQKSEAARAKELEEAETALRTARQEVLAAENGADATMELLETLAKHTAGGDSDVAAAIELLRTKTAQQKAKPTMAAGASVDHAAAGDSDGPAAPSSMDYDSLDKETRELFAQSAAGGGFDTEEGKKRVWQAVQETMQAKAKRTKVDQSTRG